MVDEEGASPAVRRALARDGLLMLARDAEQALRIVPKRDARRRNFQNEAELFTEALKRQLRAAGDAGGLSVRIQALDYAATLLRFCQLVCIPLETQHRAEELYATVLRELEDAQEELRGVPVDRDLHLGAVTLYRAIRDLRLRGEHDAVIDLAAVSESHFFATGAEPYFARVQFEVGASLLLDGQADQVHGMLAESEKEYWNATRAGRYFASRHRVDVILGLAAWELGDPADAAGRLAGAREHLRRTGHGQERYDTDELSVVLARAECLAGGDPPVSVVNEAIDCIAEAIETTERIRGRWGVIARSRSPLSVAFRRLYGDIALAAAALPGRQAAELGLRTVLSAKQTGFASRMRTDRSLMTPQVRDLVDLIVSAEMDAANTWTAGDVAEQTTKESLEGYRRDLHELVSPMLADTILPVPASAARLVDLVGSRHALDYVALPDTLTPDANWFRTLIAPDGAMVYERFAPGDHLTAFFRALSDEHASVSSIIEPEQGDGADWRALARELLPRRLLDRLAEASKDEPISLVISAHSALSLLPWPALTIDDTGTRLVERAVLTHTPVLTCLTGDPVPAVGGPALVRLVSEAVGGVDVEEERLAWDLPDENGHVPLSRCAVGPDPSPTRMPGTLISALVEKGTDWGFVHVAAHGDGSGLDQCLRLPEPLTAGQALALRWAPSALMASCDVGRLVNIADAEPLSIVMALLTGGCQCVVAGIDKVSDPHTGEIAADLVRHSRRGARLDEALRRAQLDLLYLPETSWALLNAYTR